MLAVLLLPAGRRGKTATQDTDQKVVSIAGELQTKAVSVEGRSLLLDLRVSGEVSRKR